MELKRALEKVDEIFSAQKIFIDVNHLIQFGHFFASLCSSFSGKYVFDALLSFNRVPSSKRVNHVSEQSSNVFAVDFWVKNINSSGKLSIKTNFPNFFRSVMVRLFAAPVDLRCSNFDVSRLRDISYQCGKELTCFFENVRADNETQFIYSSDRHVLSYKCVGFVNSSMYQLPIDLFKRFHNAEILYAANLGLKFVSRTLFDTANKLVDIHLEGNNLTGKLCLSI